jgi:hypothetical protein
MAFGVSGLKVVRFSMPAQGTATVEAEARRDNNQLCG